ncbi:MAG: aminotransferase class V-fold PLP-dependent enzyme [Acidobacteriaceae bacterium]|nr:aminotransferase class V-fold PLP-dependent enzyme [Acidobacteriaceae bacterium]
MNPGIQEAVTALGDAPLCEPSIERHIAPLFSRVLSSDRVYLANHSLGRPLDAMSDDIAEAVALWYDRLGDAWDAWLEEREAFRARIAELIHAPRHDCVVPKTSAGQGLRSVLNTLTGKPRVVSTRGEFDSIDVILKQYASLDRIAVDWIEPDLSGNFSIEPLIEAAIRGADLVVVSQIMFMTGQIVDGLDRLADACHSHGARLLVDSYHAIGVIPVDAAALSCDFMIGGSYKYLRGGPGACFLYISPEVLKSGLRPLDTGWFANSDEFAYERPDPPVLKCGGDAYLESTPPVLTWYQARSGQQFTLAMGVERLRAYSLRQLGLLRAYLADAGVDSAIGGDSGHGAFLAIRLPNATQLPPLLDAQGIVTDARGEWLRLCPDCLTRDEELRRAASVLGNLLYGTR